MSSRSIEIARQALIDQYNAQAGRTNGVTTEQAEALQGNSGTPSDSNRYLTELDGASYVVGPASAVDSNIAEFDTTTGKLIKDGLLTHANAADAISKKHTQGTDTTLGAMTADVNMNTHQVTALSVPDANGEAIRQTAKITEVLLESATDLKHSQNTDSSTSSSTFSVGGLKFFGKSVQLADHDTQVLTTVAATYPAHGFVQVCVTSTIAESAEFEMGSDGTVNIIRGTANVVANIDTTAKFCIGTSAAQNPLTIKNHLEATVQAIIQFWHG